MFQGWKIVAVTPAGRKCHLEILAKYIFANKHLIDECHLWDNAWVQEDKDFLASFSKNNSFIKLIPMPVRLKRGRTLAWGASTICNFYPVDATDHSVIYIRFDDDIVFIAKDAIENLLKFRVENTNPIVIAPVIIQNAVMSHLLQKHGILPKNVPGRPEVQPCTYDCLCNTGWKSPEFSFWLHEYFLNDIRNNCLSKYKIPSEELKGRFSINCICWFGRDFAKVYIHCGEETCITEELPKILNRPNWLCGNSLVGHFAFGPTRETHSPKLRSFLDDYARI